MCERVGAPLCCVEENTLNASSITVDPTGQTWFARDKALFRCSRTLPTPQALSREPSSVACIVCTETFVFTFTSDGTFAMWNFGDSEPRVRGALSRRFRCATRISNDRVAIAVRASNTDDEIVLLQPQGGENGSCRSGVTAVGLYTVEGAVTAMAWWRDQDRETLVSVSERGNVECWNVGRGEEDTARFDYPVVPLGELRPTAAVLVSEDVLWIGTDHGLVVQFSLFGQARQLQQQHEAAVTSISLLSDGDSVWSTSLDGTIVVWRTSTGEALGTFQTGSVGIRDLASRSVLHTEMWVLDTQNVATRWSVQETVHWCAGRCAPECSVLANDAIAQMQAILCDDAGRELSPPVRRAFPEAQLVADALGSLKEASQMIEAALSEIGSSPHSLLDDVGTICSVAVEALRAEKELDPTAGFPQSTTLTRTKTVIAREQTLRREYESLSKRCDAAEARAARLEHDVDASNRASGDKGIVAADHQSRAVGGLEDMKGLREELAAKNAFVMELLEIVKQNTDAIEELRSKYKGKKSETIVVAARNRELLDSITDALEVLRDNSDPASTQARILLEKAVRHEPL